MRVFHIMAGKGNGGAETYAADMIIALQEAGIDQRVVVHPQQARLGDLLQAGVDAVTAPLQRPLRWLQRRAVAKQISEFKPDLIHCWMRRAAELVAPTQLPVIGWFGGYYEPRHFAQCSHFVGVTPDIVSHQRTQGVAADRSFFVPTFPVIATQRPVQGRAELQTAPDATVLLALSRLHPKKGLDTLLTALAELPGCVLWLAGDGPLLGALQTQARALGVAERVRFLGWRDDRGALLQAADICVLPSRYEPFGTVMLEAWASDTPLVAAAAAGPAAYVRNGENGMLVPIDDAVALAGAIRQVQQDRSLRARIISGGQATYQAQFTRPAVVRQMRGLYDQIVAQGRGS